MKLRRLQVQRASRSAKKTPSLMAYVTEMYGFPEDVTVRRVAHGRRGLEQDAKRIKGYFQEAAKRLEPELLHR